MGDTTTTPATPVTPQTAAPATTTTVAPTADVPAGDPLHLNPRFAELIAERNTLRTQMDGLVTAKVNERTAAHQAEVARLNERLGLSRVGIHDETALDVASLLYERLPPTERPQSVSAWVAAMVTDPTQAPPALRGYLTPATGAAPIAQPATSAAPAAAATATTAAPAVATINPDAGAVGTSPDGALVEITPQAIEQALKRAQMTGDWKDFEELSRRHFERQRAGR